MLSGDFLVVQWLRLHAPNAGGPGSIPALGNRSCMPQLKILHAAAKTWQNHINQSVIKKNDIMLFYLCECILVDTVIQNELDTN